MSEDGVKKSTNPWVSLTAGAIAGNFRFVDVKLFVLLGYFLSLFVLVGGIECIAVWPMEYIKTQLQLQKLGGPKPAFNGMIEGLIYTVRTTGFFSLYRGLSVTLVRFLWIIVRTCFNNHCIVTDWFDSKSWNPFRRKCLL
jgi:hypothetical protein